MKKTTYSYEIKKIHEKNYNKEKITEKVKKQIDEIGFSVFELDMQILLDYYESNKDKLEENKKDSSEVKIFIGSSLLAFFLFSLPFLFKFYIKLLEKFWFLIILTILILTFIYFYYQRRKIKEEIEKKKKNYFNKYVLVTNDKIFIQDKKYYIKNGNILSNQEVEKIIFPEIDFFYEVDKEKIEKINNMMDSIDGEIKNHAKNLKKISFDLENFPKIILELEKEAKSIQDIEGKLWDLKNFIDNWILNQKIILITFSEINIDIKKIENKLKNQILKNIISLKEKFYSELKERIKKEKIGSELTIKNFDGIFSSINKRIEEFKKLCEIEIHSLKQETNQKIEEIEIMFETGLLEEVQNLLKICKKDDFGMRTIGYKEVIDYLDGKLSLGDCIDLVKKHN
ncbi:hypothetical protein DLH72_00755, partial [Candidatus Gracilibacteria bacterium]